jgi:hypothetical protein
MILSCINLSSFSNDVLLREAFGLVDTNCTNYTNSHEFYAYRKLNRPSNALAESLPSSPMRFKFDYTN